MRNREISLTPGAEPQEALGIARAALERHGYRWVSQTDSSAEVHEGGKEIRGLAVPFKLRMNLAVQHDRLVMEAVVHGLGLPTPNGAPAGTLRIRNKLNHCADLVDSALSQAGLVR
ncbi:hypothetical protein EST92_28660 [Streptomyces sp. TM32]|uniref:hypothetical protein n=1 Tax=Streptomyces sp. TM32 TaxID=1652669 RepID=UPI0010117E56|nr:hypothetical protein [Streptomyces sp. TM32]RXS66594.1 hypothetical protein EST92_28660 [Streptomyces sp. TM32]